MFSRLVCSAAALALSAGAASGGVMFESEPNDTPLTANDAGGFTFPGGSRVIDGFITPGFTAQDPEDDIPGDVDWFTFSLTDSGFVGISAFAFENSFTNGDGPVEADSALMLLNSDGVIINFSDDDGPGLNPSIGAFLSAGTYILGIAPYEDLVFDDGLRGKRGFGDLPSEIFDGLDEFNGNRPTEENFVYKIIIGANVAPAPGAATLLGLSGVVALRRRR